MSDTVTKWLEQLGLGQYAEAFEENAIGPEHLPDLDDVTLRELGIRALGHRMTILKAAAQPEGQVGTEADYALPTRLLSPEAERRQLTVMFSDLVGSTELSQKLDPEDLREVNRAYQDACKAAIERYEGYVARYMGDGVLAYFGYPRAHEDDAERAIFAGLGVVESVVGLNTTVGDQQAVELGVRVGIATGPVVVGDIIGEGASQESAVVGETPGLAARLQSIAEPNAVVVAPDTHRLTRGNFQFRTLGERRLKGIARLVEAWQVLGEGTAESRFDALRGRRLTPLVGRDEEAALLVSRWERAKEGEGQVVLISGEPGIGKSRLCETLRARISEQPQFRLGYQCSPHHANSAFHPVIRQLERAAEIRLQSGAAEKFDRLESLLRESSDALEEDVPLLAALLSIPLAERYSPIDIDAQEHKERTFEVLVHQVEALSAQRPVLIIFEDLHWVDPSTLELLDRFVERVQELQVLMLITFRPEFHANWMGQRHVTSLTLKRISKRESRTLLNAVVGGDLLSGSVVNEIVAKTDGVPLFIEEVTRALLDAQKSSGESALDHTQLEVPRTLQDSLMARLDRLGPAKEVAQIGAAIGREFAYEILSAVVPLDHYQLQDALSRLADSELVFCRGVPPNTTYTFKHVLIRDAAYESLLKSKRQELHGRIATIFERRYPETVKTSPELVAFHFGAGNERARAIDYWLKAGKGAMSRAAPVEAIGHLREGLKLLESLPDTAERSKKELPLQMALGSALITVKGWNALESHATYRRARELCRGDDDPHQLFAALWGIWTFHGSAVNQQEALELIEELFVIAERVGDPELQLQAHHAAWGTTTCNGELNVALDHIKKGLAIYDPVKHRSHALRFAGHDPGVCGKGHQALMLWYSGYSDQAMQSAEEGIELARDSDHRPSIPHALVWACFLHQLRGEYELLATRAEELVEHGKMRVVSEWAGYVFRGWARSRLERPQAGLSELRDGLAAKKGRSFVGYMMTLLGQTLAAAHAYNEATKTYHEALDVIRQTGEHLWESEIHRLMGDLILTQGGNEHQRVEVHFHEAMEVARAQGARSMELRAATSLARLWRGQGQSERASQCLAPIYGWFTEGFDTPDLCEAKTLLEELS